VRLVKGTESMSVTNVAQSVSNDVLISISLTYIVADLYTDIGPIM